MLNIKATDIKAAALKIASHNTYSYKIKNIEFIKSDWFCNIKKYDYDLIVSNPPFISNNDPCLKNSDIKFEPASALISVAPLIIVAFVVERYLSKGNLSGALK